MTAEKPAPATARELGIAEQVALYQREFPTVDPQVETIVQTLSRVARRMTVAYDRQLTVLGITSAEWEVLKALVVSGSPYRLGPGELAKRLGLTPAAMTHRVDRMVAEGLVTRDRDEANRVRVIIELTDLGRDKWLESMRMAAVFEEELLQDVVGEDRAVLAGMLARMLRRIEESRPDTPARAADQG
ncbi:MULTISPECIES: MarR family transcriptional regulator [unclassified Streptomyces]|uniref:MarR family winged helix-turn-helix transcriptional regulator n=1 Tax=unclassified Streptomyces TaxID=2593676 RepID=UPI0005F8F111|nr:MULTISPECIES: MarR family transcriptional regulator [unclassified Streptomyces]KJY38461.1 MarR family transcriptional regulator [Streptomyces sp. NRRL S-495]KOV10071.1 MarR family transcriptional regulator [Streptomyces sp. XY431]